MGKVDQDRLDLLVGREKRTRKEFARALADLRSSLHWCEERLELPARYVDFTTAFFDREVAPTLPPRFSAVEATLRALLEVRDELAALRQ